MKYTFPEQDIRHKVYSNPISFIRDYIYIYTKQSSVPCKIFRDEINYYKIFEQTFISYLIKKNTEEEIDLLEYLEIEDLLTSFTKEMFYDKIFYEATHLIYLKGIAMLLDKVDSEVCNYVLTNIKILYFFSSEKINLYNLFLKKLTSNVTEHFEIKEEFWKDLSMIREYMIKINEEVEAESYFINDKELLKRINISEQLLGDTKVYKYEMEELLKLLLSDMEHRTEEKEQLYIFIINFNSEYLIREIGPKRDLIFYTEYSKRLLEE